METCSFCEETLPDRGKLIKHIRYLHHINLQYFCRYQCFGCKIFYDNYQSFQKHKCKTNGNNSGGVRDCISFSVRRTLGQNG